MKSTAEEQKPPQTNNVEIAEVLATVLAGKSIRPPVEPTDHPGPKIENLSKKKNRRPRMLIIAAALAAILLLLAFWVSS